MSFLVDSFQIFASVLEEYCCIRIHSCVDACTHVIPSYHPELLQVCDRSNYVLLSTGDSSLKKTWSVGVIKSMVRDGGAMSIKYILRRESTFEESSRFVVTSVIS